MAPELNTKPSVCFVAHFAYGAISGRPTGHIGGVEHQQAIMARWLAARGWPVTMLTWDEGQGAETLFDGVRVLGMCGRDAGVWGVRFVHPRWTSLNAAMRRADADVYYQNCGEYVTGQVAWWCRRHGRVFVYSVANDLDVEPDLPDMKAYRERMLYRYGLRHADQVVVQTRRQQRRLREGWGLESIMIPMPCLAERNKEYQPPDVPGSNGARVLWIGRIAEQKRPDRLLEVARACPDLTFDVLGVANVPTDYSRRVLEDAAALPNIVMHGYVPYEQIAPYYRRAALLCCTSDYEGFPNTFLEAWSLGLPVVSTIDPDDLIAERTLGRVASDAPGVVRGIRELLESQDAWREASRNARAYYVGNHRLDAVMPQFERVFIELSTRVRGAKGVTR